MDGEGEFLGMLAGDRQDLVSWPRGRPPRAQCRATFPPRGAGRRSTPTLHERGRQGSPDILGTYGPVDEERQRRPLRALTYPATKGLSGFSAAGMSTLVPVSASDGMSAAPARTSVPPPRPPSSPEDLLAAARRKAMPVDCFGSSTGPRMLKARVPVRLQLWDLDGDGVFCHRDWQRPLQPRSTFPTPV